MLEMSNKFTIFPIEPTPGISAPPLVRSESPLSLLRIIAIIEVSPMIIPESSGARKTMFERMSETISAKRSLNLSFIFLMFFT